ncbi:maltooligosyl trehalose hydrolase [Singulisphaera sp. GP187]|uniref:malto-oligosyltrehalose trehalohydrolase n=1 Tax=Singulisphaera sp. GP187 TaxID=1882752 RepID=UPI0009295B86|nr:malto-oligosyltrehalose trehalohydrolase [Singulisphaera sp. GP187]SIO60301.1 maltooligosyl trehalose hydrolase [Singulisphaera sp. GP187]
MSSSDQSLGDERSRLWRPTLGAWPDEGGAGTRFRVWAPEARSVEVVHLPSQGGESIIALERSDDGTFGGRVEAAVVGDRYLYRLDAKGTYPDPASRFQPEGVHGPSTIVDPAGYRWSDQGWRGVNREALVIHEIHVGTFSPEGTFAGLTDRLPWLVELGVTALELMPVADFAGSRSWGYDGVDLFAPSRSYGTPDDLRRLVDQAHRVGLAVILDVVYNHFGPVGNYAPAFSPNYLSTTHRSVWAACVNLDGERSAWVREFFIENALHWVHEYHVDGLRLDATHELHDDSARHFLAELTSRVRASAPDRELVLIAEDDRNLAKMVQPESVGGWGLDGVWADDFHHQIRRFLAGDHEGYYRDYSGSIPDLVETLNQGWYYHGQPSIHQGIGRGTDPRGLAPRSFVFCLQNHDQIGNRAFGDRLSLSVDLAAYRAATALLLTAPAIPLLFMGQEWAATTPFLYFTDHEEDLGKLVTQGRRQEFRHFQEFVDPEARERIPDPQAASTFAASRLDWSEPERAPHAATLNLYRALLALRRRDPALCSNQRDDVQAIALDDASLLLLRRSSRDGATLLIVVRLRGAGAVRLENAPALGLPSWWDRLELVLTTEDPSFAVDPLPVEIDRSQGVPLIRFRRAGAVVLRIQPPRGNV